MEEVITVKQSLQLGLDLQKELDTADDNNQYEQMVVEFASTLCRGLKEMLKRLERIEGQIAEAAFVYHNENEEDKPDDT